MKDLLAATAEATITAAGGAALGLAAGLVLGGPVGAVLGAAFAGLNGLAAGARGIYDWRSARGWVAFVTDSTWGLAMTALGVVLSGANVFVPATRHANELSRRQNRHVFDGGLALQRNMALTLGNVTSNGNPTGHGLNREFLTHHEGLHIWQARFFGPLFPLVYIVWGTSGAIVGALVWLFHRDESLPQLVQTAAYFDNPFEYWAYRNDSNWPPVGAHPLLAWGPKGSRQ
jgi:hypothetical protein